MITQEENEKLKQEIGVLTSCRDHWKISYEKLRKLLSGEESCKKCKGRGYTIFYDNKTYPVPHEEKHTFLCGCVEDKIIKLIQNKQLTSNQTT